MCSMKSSLANMDGLFAFGMSRQTSSFLQRMSKETARLSQREISPGYVVPIDKDKEARQPSDNCFGNLLDQLIASSLVAEILTIV